MDAIRVEGKAAKEKELVLFSYQCRGPTIMSI